MKDLTQGSIVWQLVRMAAPVTFGMVFQTLYYVVDLYFVARLGDAAIAGVSAAGNVMLIVFSLTQMLSVGVVALISHAVGRKDQPEANLIFNQSLVLSALFGAITLICGYLITPLYMQWVAADAATAQAGTIYMLWFIPGLALQFALVAMGAALRSTGIVKPTMIVHAISVALNIILAPVLMAGWGTGYPMGVAGAGLASTLAIAAAVAVLGIYFFRMEKYVAFHRDQWRPRLESWKRILGIGLPAGAELVLLFILIGVTYSCIRDFGATTQAGFGIGSRVLQCIFLPAAAVAFALGPIAGQNFGAKRYDRVRETFYKGSMLISVLMALLTVLIYLRPTLLVSPFTLDPAVQAVATGYLKILSWCFVAQGLVFACSGLFQGLGDMRPALLSTLMQLITFAPAVLWVSAQPGFRFEHVVYISVATVTLHAIVSLLLVRRYFSRRLPPMVAIAAAA